MSDINRSVLLLRIPQDNSKKEDAADEFFTQLAEILKGRGINLSAEIAIYDKFLWFFLTCPENLENIVKGQWYSQYPGTEIEEIKDYAEKLFNSNNCKYFAGCELYYDQPELIPLLTYKSLKKNPLVSLSGATSSFENTETGIVQIIIKPPKKENLWDKYWKNIRENQRNKLMTKDKTESQYLVLQDNKDEQPCYTTSIRFLALGNDLDRAQINLSLMTTIYKQTLERPKLQKFKEDRIQSNKGFLNSFVNRSLGWYQQKISPEEIATIFHLPHNDEQIDQIIQIRSKKAPAPQNLPIVGDDLAIFGQTNFQNDRKTFGIKVGDRRRHLYTIGKTGMGKSKLIELLLSSDLNQKRGIILIDPHGDLAKEVLSIIPENRFKEVVYFDPSDIENPIGFNPMEGIGSFEFRQNIVANFISIFKKLFGLNWNERFEHVLRYTTLALLEYPKASILGIPRMLTDNLFRQEVIRFVTDPIVKKFWATEYASWNEQFANEAIVPIINKVGQFIANPMIRNIVGQAKTGFSLDEIMNKEKILIANLSIGKLGEENSALLGSMLITKIWQTAMARASIPEEKRKDVYMYIDEFQNFATNAFTNIFSESRKYRLNLIIAHQYMQQLSNEVRAAVFGNVGNIISFRVGGDDAQILAKEFEPVFKVNDFLNLDIRNFFIKMSINGQISQPFSAQTITFEKLSEDKSQEIINLSRQQWARKKKEVEQEIEKWEKGELVTAEKKETEEYFPEPLV